MIFVNQKAKLAVVPVKVVGKEWINVSWKDDHMISKTRGVPGVCYIVAGNYPPGVVPKAVYATAEIQGRRNMITVGAMGIAATECQAIIKAKTKLRRKLTQAAKAMKHTIVLDSRGYKVIMKDTSSRMYGHGCTLPAALANLQMNINIVETTALQAEKADEVFNVTPPSPPKWKWYHWFRNPEGVKK